MECRVCDSNDLELAIDLGKQPWGNHFLNNQELGKEPFYPLKVVYCHNCHTAQINYTVKKEIMFSDHTYLSGTTTSLSHHFKEVAKDIDTQFFSGKEKKNVLDIGSNDGTQLKHYNNLGFDVLGVESSRTIARMANEAGIETINNFFNLELVKRLARKFDVINASGVFFHLEELHSVCEGIRHALKEDGVFVVQFLYMKSIMENCAFDQIYHEHLLFYNLKTIETLLNRHDLSLFDARFSPIHGGSIIAYVSHKDKRSSTGRLLRLWEEEQQSGCNEFSAYLNFADRIKEMKEKNLALLKAAKEKGKTIFGFGAPVKGNTLLNYFGISTNFLDCLVEKNTLRKGLYSPGMHIPILIEEELNQLPDIYFVLAWNFKNEILANNQHLLDKGIEFYFPVNPKEF